MSTPSSLFSKPSTSGAAATSDTDKAQQPASPFRTPSPFASATGSGQSPAPSPFRSAERSAEAENRPTSPFRTQTTPAANTRPSAFSRPADTARPASPTTAATATVRPASPFTARPGEAARATPGSAFKQQCATPAQSLRSASPFRKDLQITDDEFIQLRDFIYQQCGIFIAENRKYLVENRLSNRIKELNLKSYNEYYNYLRFDGNRRTEMNKLFEVITTNETSFFRNPPQLEVFQKTVLPDVLEQCRSTGRKRLRIWSAGCSTGEEPYTLAIILHEVLKAEIRTWDIKITANDLSEAVLAAARRGVYNEYALRTTPKEIAAAHFTKEGALYKINPAIKQLVSFGQINLSDKEQLKRVEKSQIVFCRNVIIYFDDEMKRKVINAFYDNLETRGTLLIGHSESLHNISRAFQLEHHKGTIVYKKMG